MNDAIKNAIAAHALAEYPRECCGLVVHGFEGDVYRACRNTAATPLEHFVMSPSDFAEAEDVGDIVAVVHSHPGGAATPSVADKAMCEASGIGKWIIVALGVQADGSIAVDDWCEFGPSGYVAPLLGREFVHGVHDCYSLIRDWYRAERGIELRDFERSDEWWADGKSDLYLDNYRAAGFLEVSVPASGDFEIGDVLLMQIRSKNDVPNHAGIYLGGGVLLHHMHGRLSGRTVWGGMWAQCLRKVLRYQGDES